MREIIRICDKAGIVCGTGTAAMMPNFFDKWGERDTAFLTYGAGRAAFAGWQAWNLAFGDSVSARRIAEVERLLRNEMAFKWFSIQRVGGRVMFIMTLKVARKAYNVAPPKSGPTPTPTSDEWLWFHMPSGGDVTLTKTGTPNDVVLEYSLDNGMTWTEWIEVSNVRTLTLTAGQTMHIRNQSATSTNLSTYPTRYYTFSHNEDTEIGGDIRSMLCSTASNGVLTNYCFINLFYNNTKILNAEKLLLLSSNIPTSAYRAIFYGCSNMVKGPATLTATTAGLQCCYEMFRLCTSLASSPLLTIDAVPQTGYQFMFTGCSSLVEIKTIMTDISASNALLSWVNLVAATGDFYCPASLTIPTGVSGIPTGWTRHDL